MDNWLLDLLDCRGNKNCVLITEEDIVDLSQAE